MECLNGRERLEQVATMRLLEQAEQEIAFAKGMILELVQPLPDMPPYMHNVPQSERDAAILAVRRYRSDAFALREAIESARICCERARGVVERHNDSFPLVND